MRMNPSTPPIERSCEHCGTLFRAWPHSVRKGNGRFCSRSCGNEHRTISPEERFWPKVNRVDDGDSCWEWQGGRGAGGYGKFWLNEGAMNAQAHRVSFEFHNGPIDSQILVLHRCDNPPCVRPDHLFLGAPRDNSADMTAKGRSLPGERHPNAKLTWDTVREIRRRAKGGESADSLSREFGIHLRHAFRIISGAVWRE